MAATRRVLFFGYVWPERHISAAGNLIDAFKSSTLHKYEVSFSCAAKERPVCNELRDAGVATYTCTQNNEEAVVRVLEAVRPHICVFDRFVTEEQFGHYVERLSASAMRVVDTQDLHFLRAGRAELVKQGRTLSEVLAYVPKAQCTLTQRELTSMLRSDLSLLCSTHEMALVEQLGVIPSSKLGHAPFFYDVSHMDPSPPGWADRADFLMLGNFKHNGNNDAVRWFAQDIWPTIRQALPNAVCHVYGANATKQDMDLTNKRMGLIVHGPAASLTQIMRKSRVLLAPLRIGAGIKGKICDAWFHALPVCTTPVGSEGMLQGTGDEWGGLHTAQTAQEFAADAVRIYRNEQGIWDKCQATGQRLLRDLFSKQSNDEKFLRTIDHAFETLTERREKDYVQALLWSNTVRTSDYMARWIEAKNRPRPEPST